MSASTVFYRRRRNRITIIASSALLLGLSGVGPMTSFAQNTPVAPSPTVIEETFILKHIKPSALVTFLAQGEKKPASGKTTDPAAPRNASAAVLLPPSVRSVTPDDVFSTVTVQGAPEAIAAIRKVALLIDVPAQPVRLTVRIIRYRSSTAQNAGAFGTASLADVEVIASGTVETANNIPVEITTFGDQHTFRARLIPRINNAASVTVAADLQMAAPDGAFTVFPLAPSGTRLIRVGDRGLITSVGVGISAPVISGGAGKPSVSEKTPKAPENATPETYYLEATPAIPAPASTPADTAPFKPS